MADGDTEASQLDHGLPRKSTPFKPIDVSGDRHHRSDGLKLLDDGSLADITGMKDMIDTPKMSCNHRIEQSMGIRDDTDTHHA
jgi:hypothetical protein